MKFAALFNYFGLFFVPNSPRWLILKGRFDDAKRVMTRFSSPAEVLGGKYSKEYEVVFSPDCSVFLCVISILQNKQRGALTACVVILSSNTHLAHWAWTGMLQLTHFVIGVSHKDVQGWWQIYCNWLFSFGLLCLEAHSEPVIRSSSHFLQTAI